MTTPTSSATPYRYLLFLLFCAYALSFADRVVFSLVLQPIKAALALSDSKAGLLAGAGFAITYAVFAPLGGFFIDRLRRKRIFAFAVTFWSCGSFASGLVSTPLGMMFCRASVGMGEALLVPLAVSLLADAVPVERRARAIAIFFSAGTVGSLAVSLIGGTLLQVFAHHRLALPLLGPTRPWQSLFMLLAIPGFLLSVVALVTMREPVRTAEQVPATLDQAQKQPALCFIRQNRGFMVALLLGYPVLQMAAQGIGSWTFIFLDRIHNLPPGKAGVLGGLTAGIAGVIGCVLAGPLVGFLRKQGYADASFRASLVGGLLFCFFAAAGLLARTLHVSLFFLSLASLFSYTPTIGAFAAISEVAPPAARAQIAGVSSLSLGLLTSALGPWLVGYFSDRFFPTSGGIRQALLYLTLLSAALGGTLVFAGLRPFRKLLTLRSTAS